MQLIADKIRSLFISHKSDEIDRIEKLPQSGSDRIYFRIFTGNGNYIATYNENVRENGTFLYFTEQFEKCRLPVPRIYSVDESQTIYIQQDFGDVSLLRELEEFGHVQSVYKLFQKSLQVLAALQITGGSKINYDHCLTSREFGKQAILSDLLYFKYYFLDTLKIPYDKEKLIDDFEALSNYLSYVPHKHFMFRDFQSRNILIENEEVKFIDYQGGMRGALQYDVASLLWQAKANLPGDWKDSLLEYYIDCADELIEEPIDRVRFTSQYNGYVLIRLLQVLGAYGFRGLFERKAHFLISIPLALSNLKWFLQNKNTGIALQEFERVLILIVREDVIERFRPLQANESTPLVVRINSFSYLKSGYPKDETEHRGGFVFDCRGLLNPGRIAEYKSINGRNKAVMDFLEQQTKMPEFLNSVYNIVDIAVEEYIKRGFSSLAVSFGCTGGQHRSVYAADALARHLRNKFRVNIELNHMEQNITEQRKFENSLL